MMQPAAHSQIAKDRDQLRERHIAAQESRTSVQMRWRQRRPPLSPFRVVFGGPVSPRPPARPPRRRHARALGTPLPRGTAACLLTRQSKEYNARGEADGSMVRKFRVRVLQTGGGRGRDGGKGTGRRGFIRIQVSEGCLSLWPSTSRLFPDPVYLIFPT